LGRDGVAGGWGRVSRGLVVPLSPQSLHGPSQGLSDMESRFHIRIAGRSVRGAAFDEESHHDDKSYSHDQHSIPVGRHPLSYGEQSFLIKQKIFQSYKGTLCIDLSTFEEDVAISLEIVARRSRPE